MLVALGLFSLIMLLIYSGYQTIERGQKISQERLAHSEQLRQLHQFTQRYLRHAVPVWALENHVSVASYEAEQSQLSWVSRMPVELGSAGLYRLTLAVSEPAQTSMTGAGSVLSFSRQLLHPDLIDQPADAFDDSSQLTNELIRADEISFSYWYDENEAYPADWYTDRRDDTSLPRMVKIAIRQDDRQYEIVTELISSMHAVQATILKPGETPVR